MSYDTERLIKNARNALPGSIDGAILLEFFNVLDEFFQDSSIWQEDIPFSVTPQDPAGTVYYIEPESVSLITRLFGVLQPDDIPVGASMQVPGEVTLLTPPGQSGTFIARVALTINDPTQRDGYPEFPEWTFTRYRRALLDGIVGRMMSQPAKPYTNPKLSEYHLRRFRNAVAIASTESDHKNVVGRQVWRYPQSFATRR